MFRKILVGVLALAAIAPTAMAAGPSGYARNIITAPSMNFIVERRPTLAPLAHVRFCLENPNECKAGRGGEFVALNASKRKELQAVNKAINNSIAGVNDTYGVDGDRWNVGVTSGDCEDYALTKRQMLIALGWSSRSLRVAVTRTRDGAGHAVLVVKTDRGDLVLDNRMNVIKNWRYTDLSWVKIQSSDDPNYWYSL